MDVCEISSEPDKELRRNGAGTNSVHVILTQGVKKPLLYEMDVCEFFLETGPVDKGIWSGHKISRSELWHKLCTCAIWPLATTLTLKQGIWNLHATHFPNEVDMCVK